MQLKHLCVILPADSAEFKQHPPSKVNQSSQKETKTKTKKQRRACGGQVLAFFRDSVSKLYGTNCSRFFHNEVGKGNQGSVMLFHDMDGVQLSAKIGGDSPRIFSFAELFIGSNGFSEDHVLGSGGFGRVYKAVLPSDGTVVAVKCCLAEKGQQFEKTFAAELAAVAHLRHKNLVRLRGWCVHEDQLYLVYDYMPNLSLDRLLFRRSETPNAEPLSWGRRGKIIKGLAAALYYLHEQLENQIIHRDVKTSNVMLDSQYNARLGDFGLARWLEHELEYNNNQSRKTSTKIDPFRLAETTRIGGTIGYLPPESFQKKSIATSKSDVFSFGIVVLEVASGRRAIDLAYPDDKIILLDFVRRLSDEGKLLAAGDSRLPDGSYKLSDMEHLLHVGLLCTLHEPQSRPSMKWIVEALSNISSPLPALPSFHFHPLYITLSSPSDTSLSSTNASSTVNTENVSIITNYSSSNYVTANGRTIYMTAEDRNSGISSAKCMYHHNTSFPVVEAPREISYKELAMATDHFSESMKVAELDFGTAYHGILGDRCHVMVKRLGMKTCPALRERFSNELRNLARLRHRNLVQLRGWCTEQGEMLVVYDYSATRLLSHHLLRHNNPRDGSSVLKWHHRYNIIKSLASAILYLHEEWEEHVIHRNITSSAVVLEPDMNPRLSSFALAEFLTRNEHGDHVVKDTSKSVRGIFGYMSPEYIESGEATSAADVYSFGVVMLEVISGQMAVDFRQPEVLLVKKVHEFETRKRPLENLADIRLNGEYNLKELMRLVKLGIACTRSDSKLRPNMRQIVSILDGNDRLIMEKNQKESTEDWKERNSYSLSLIRRIQALGIR